MAITNGPNLNSVPAAKQQALSTNYLDLNTSGAWAQQYVPDLMEKEAEVFGPRTISGFLAQIGAEEAMTADQVIWSEQGRLHFSYKGKLSSNNTFLIQADIDEATSITAGLDTAHGVRVNDTVIVSNVNGVVKAMVTAITNNDELTLATYDGSTIAQLNTNLTTTILVYGSEFAKGVGYNAAGAALDNDRTAHEPQFKTFSNKPIIMKDYYEVSGSDSSRIGWVEVSTEAGQAGYLWYLKAEADTRARFTDYVEMAMLESEIGSDNAHNLGAGGSGAAHGVDAHLGLSTGDNTGTEGLFAAIEDRGNVNVGFTAAAGIDSFDAILKNLDTQGAIEENMLFLQRQTALDFDDMLANISGGYAGGTAFGLFENSEEMALNLGFSGFRRGSYDFYKTDWKYLNDASTRGAMDGVSSIEGVLIPAGTSTVYDQILGTNIRRPFLHVRYRASQADDRRMKSWLTGSVGGAFTSTLDAMEVNFLSERCLVTQGANNFVLFKGV